MFGMPESTDELEESTHCGVGIASSPRALRGGVRGALVSG